MTEMFQSINSFFSQSAGVWFVALAILFIKANKLLDRHGEMIHNHNERINNLESWKRNSQ